MRAPPRQSSWTMYRLAVASRTLAAIAGGYVLASASAAALAVWLPGAPVDAVMAGMMVSFVVFVGAAIWCFAARSAWRAWWPIVMCAGLLTALWALKSGALA